MQPADKNLDDPALLLKEPFVLTEAGATGLRVACANRPAEEKGVAAGLRFTDATARAPELRAEPIDRAADARALLKLAEWLVRFAPFVALDGDDGLMLDATGCAHLHGGERAMLNRLAVALNKADIAHQLAFAATPRAAAAAARYWPEREPAIIPTGQEKQAFEKLPMAALDLSEETLLTLRRFGLTRIGQLYNAPRKALARRFNAISEADAVLLRLDEILGVRIKPLRPLRPAPDFIERLSCPEPLLSSDGVIAGLQKLTPRLCKALQTRGEGGRLFTFFAFRTDGTAAQLEATTAAPVNNARHLQTLFREKIDGINPGFGIDMLAIEARRVTPMAATPRPLSGALAKDAMDITAISALADRITAKLGAGSVYIAAPQDAHAPQDAEVFTAFEGAFPPSTPRDAFSALRPLRILQTPEPITALAALPDGPPARFVWRRVPRRIVRADGPERIAPDWRRQGNTHPRTRDYYHVEDDVGRRYWLYRDGLYDDADETHCAMIAPASEKQEGQDPDTLIIPPKRQPQWFLYGFFA